MAPVVAMVNVADMNYVNDGGCFKVGDMVHRHDGRDQSGPYDDHKRVRIH